ncbi:MAG TPA: hypothetical protein DCS55_02660 [Acidimicrobiaceae bacterium]|nr:hypothetical protein [Acidimicrobiaceae bacterium]
MWTDRVRLVRFLIVLLGAGALLAACGGSSDESAAGSGLRELTLVAPSPSLHYASIQVAIDEGFFADEGLDVDLTTITGPTSGHVSAVLSGEAWGFAGGFEHVVLSNERGSDLRAVFSFASRVTNAIVAADPDFTLGDDPAAALAGTRIGVSEVGRSPHFLIRAYLESLGLDPDRDVTLLEGAESARLAALESGQADLAVVAEIPAAQGIADGRWEDIVFDLSDFGPYLQPVIGVTQSTIEQDEETVAAFVRALIRAQQWIYDEPDATLDHVLSFYGDADEAAVGGALDRAIERGLWTRDGRPTSEAFERVSELASYLAEQDVDQIDASASFDQRFVGGGG